MSVFFRNAAAMSLLAAVILFAGCEKKSSTVTVTGTVLRNGQPLQVGPTGIIQVTLQPDLPPEQAFSPRLGEADKATGKFEIREVPPGKYKVGVQQLDPDPTNDKLNGAFAAPTGKMTREIDGKTPLNIDLAKPGGSP